MENNLVQMLLGLGIGIIVVLFLIELLMLISMWRIFSKAGQPGWAILIPIYNLLTFLKVVNKPAWWFLLFLSPVLGVIVTMMSPAIGSIITLLSFLFIFVLQIILLHRLSLSFGKGAGFTVGIILLPYIFIPMLAFGKAEYKKLEN